MLKDRSFLGNDKTKKKRHTQLEESILANTEVHLVRYCKQSGTKEIAD